MVDEEHQGEFTAANTATGVTPAIGAFPAGIPSPERPDPLPSLIADAEPAALGRTVLAVAAMHEPDERGRCRVCGTRWRWRRAARGQSWCSTRRMLWATLVGSQPAGSH